MNGRARAIERVCSTKFVHLEVLGRLPCVPVFGMLKLIHHIIIKSSPACPQAHIASFSSFAQDALKYNVIRERLSQRAWDECMCFSLFVDLHELACKWYFA